MKHTRIYFFVTAVALGLSSVVIAKSQATIKPIPASEGLPERLARLRTWAGKYPSDEQNSTKQFWDLPEIKLPLLKMLGRKDFSRLSGRSVHSVESAIEVKGDYLFAGNCQYHCCSCRNNLLVANLRSGKMYVIFRDLSSKPNQERVRWSSSQGRNVALPKELCEYVGMGIPGDGCRK